MSTRALGPLLALLALVLTVRWGSGDGRVAVPILLAWAVAAVVTALAPGRLRGLAVACATTLLVLAAAEGALELRSLWRGRRATRGSPERALLDPVLGWRYQPGVWRDDRKATGPLTIAPTGFRVGSRRAGQEAPVALVLGDSFAFGFHLGDDQTVSFLLEERLAGGVDVVDLSMSGWGPHQTLALLELGLERRLTGRRKVVSCALFTVVDGLRPTGQRRWSRFGPWYEVRDGRLQLVGDLRDRRPWREELAWRTALGERAGRLFWPDRPDPELYAALLCRVAELFIRRYHVPITFVLADGTPEVPVGLLAARLRTLGARVVAYASLLPAGQVGSFRIPNDGHPNAAGAALVAEYLAGEIERLGIVPAAPAAPVRPAAP